MGLIFKSFGSFYSHIKGLSYHNRFVAVFPFFPTLYYLYWSLLFPLSPSMSDGRYEVTFFGEVSLELGNNSIEFSAWLSFLGTV